MNTAASLAPAARAFDAIADSFDDRFEPWLSVAAQRRTVRRELLRSFPAGARVIDVGGGTGLDAAWLAARGRTVLLTDPAPQMLASAAAKLGSESVALAGAEGLHTLSGRFGSAAFDGAYSNFAALNCVSDLTTFGNGLASLLRPGAPVLLVLFGTFCPAEFLVEAARGRYRNLFRRLNRTEAPARLAGHNFPIRYHRARALRAALGPWFDYRGRRAVGLFVPPSAAEPWISRHRHLLSAFERLDRGLGLPLATLGDHVLYRFERNQAPAAR